MGRASQYGSASKAKVASKALRGDITLQELDQRYSLSPSKISEWLNELETHAHQVFDRNRMYESGWAIQE
ncbi:MAG: hypothetical protein Q4A64_04255 [Porphyromonadaceae bacterium]|nr:hypothetical protein [Porphyromonadaceae bacterium]